jgi:hypothetical protein
MSCPEAEVPIPSPDLSEQLRRVVDALDRGDLTAGPLARAHLAGALDALDAQQTPPAHES